MQRIAWKKIIRPDRFSDKHFYGCLEKFANNPLSQDENAI